MGQAKDKQEILLIFIGNLIALISFSVVEQVRLNLGQQFYQLLCIIRSQELQYSSFKCHNIISCCRRYRHYLVQYNSQCLRFVSPFCFFQVIRKNQMMGLMAIHPRGKEPSLGTSDLLEHPMQQTSLDAFRDWALTSHVLVTLWAGSLHGPLLSIAYTFLFLESFV